MQKARRHATWTLRPLVSTRFQVLFHSPVRGSFHLSLTVLVHYRSLRSIQPYRMVPADSHKASPTSRYSGYYQANILYVYWAITMYRRASHPVPLLFANAMLQSYNPHFAVTRQVWALSLSLATTQEIILIFSSSAYLDVSVRQVCSLCDQSSTSRVAPFGNLRINSYLQIPEAYRSLSRPSSPLRAKASPVYSFLLSSTYTPFAPYSMLFCSCYDVSYLSIIYMLVK